MSGLTLTDTRLRLGVWEGRLRGADGDEAPELTVTHMDEPVAGVELIRAEEPGCWQMRLPLPPEALSDGVQTLQVWDTRSGELLGRVTLIAGDPPADDLRAEVDLLRAELDMLKRAFRRHCRETG